VKSSEHRIKATISRRNAVNIVWQGSYESEFRITTFAAIHTLAYKAPERRIITTFHL
jgi:hypothetical protein